MMQRHLGVLSRAPALALLLALAACGSGSEDSTSGSGSGNPGSNDQPAIQGVATPSSVSVVTATNAS